MNDDAGTRHEYVGYVDSYNGSFAQWECSCGAFGALRYPAPPLRAEARFAWLQRIKADHALHAQEEARHGS